jgi:hypothetical protein
VRRSSFRKVCSRSRPASYSRDTTHSRMRPLQRLRRLRGDVPADELCGWRRRCSWQLAAVLFGLQRRRAIASHSFATIEARGVCDQFTVTRLGQLFFFAMSGHAGPIQIDVGVTPVVCRISCGQAAALLKGRRACLADLNLSSRASDGYHDQPRSRDGRCQPERLHDTSPSIGHQRLRRRHRRLALSRKVDQANEALFPGWLTRDACQRTGMAHESGFGCAAKSRPISRSNSQPSSSWSSICNLQKRVRAAP